LAPTVGIAATGFCYPGGILQLFHRRYQQIFLHHQDQQILRLRQQQRAGSFVIIFIDQLNCAGTTDSSQLSFSIGNQTPCMRLQQLARPKI
jgi:hypothetical protein